MSRRSLRAVALFLVLSATGASLQAQEPELDDSEQNAEPTLEVEGLDWQQELDAIADLLIDGQALEAKKRADDLLETDELPLDAAARCRELRDKAEAKLAGGPAPETRPTIEIPASSGKTEGVEKKEVPQGLRPTTFQVRVALIGSGFGEGTSGALQISETGLSFVRTGQSRPDWSIRFKDLVEARKDAGIWDAPFPLVLIERGGRKHFLALIDSKGNYLPGTPLLAALEKGRRRHAAPNPDGAEPEP